MFGMFEKFGNSHLNTIAREMSSLKGLAVANIRIFRCKRRGGTVSPTAMQLWPRNDDKCGKARKGTASPKSNPCPRPKELKDSNMETGARVGTAWELRLLGFANDSIEMLGCTL